VRVVSMPCVEVFERQDAAYREAVLPKACRKRVAIEAGVTGFWGKYVGLDGAVIGIDSFGASAPAEKLFPHFGITVERLIEVSNAL
jgi:transketolase